MSNIPKGLPDNITKLMADAESRCLSIATDADSRREELLATISKQFGERAAMMSQTATIVYRTGFVTISMFDQLLPAEFAELAKQRIISQNIQVTAGVCAAMTKTPEDAFEMAKLLGALLTHEMVSGDQLVRVSGEAGRAVSEALRGRHD
jgi:2-methylisocitrate lyase-like PEP mutase family enzyme